MCPERGSLSVFSETEKSTSAVPLPLLLSNEIQSASDVSDQAQLVLIAMLEFEESALKWSNPALALNPQATSTESEL
jgi:hypothetical protein